MVLGISSFTYGWSVGIDENQPGTPMTEVDLIRKATEHSIKCIQIGDNLPLDLFPMTRLERLRKVAQENSIRLEIGARGLTRIHLANFIRIARELRSPLLRFITDGSGNEPVPREIIAIIKEVVPVLVEANLTLGLENHDRFKAKELASIIESIGSDHVGICLDCVNSMGAGEGLEQVSDMLAPYTINLHIKDFTVQRLPHKMGFTVTGVPAGTGMTNVPMLLEKLAVHKRCQSAVLEQWVPWQETLSATIETEKRWADQGITYLKSLPYFEKSDKHKQII